MQISLVSIETKKPFLTNNHFPFILFFFDLHYFFILRFKEPNNCIFDRYYKTKILLKQVAYPLTLS